jgi:hypothetical protein
MSETPYYENVPEPIRPYVAEIEAKALDLIKANPELLDVPPNAIAIIYRAGVLAGFKACTDISREHSQ